MAQPLIPGTWLTVSKGQYTVGATREAAEAADRAEGKPWSVILEVLANGKPRAVTVRGLDVSVAMQVLAQYS